MTTERESGLPHILRLDCLRAIAALLVIFEHVIVPLLPMWMAFHPGGVGVYFFFVLSGFLITDRLATRTGPPSARIGSFYLRRASRIFPLYYLVLFSGAALAIPGFRESLPWGAFYLNNFQMLDAGRFAGYAGHFWTLAVEEQFYLLWPLLFLFLGRSATLTFAIGAVLMGIGYRFFAFDPKIYALHLISPLASFDLLAIGGLLNFWLRHSGPRAVEARLRRWVPVSASAAAAFCILAGMAPGALHPLGLAVLPTLTSLFFGWAIARAVLLRERAPLWGERPLAGLGRISYGIYVYHLPILFFVLQWEGGVASVPARLLGIVATVGVAALSWRFFEAPLLRRGRALTGTIFKGQAPAGIKTADTMTPS